MRNIQSCILRRLVDSDHPLDFRGNIHCVDDGKKPAFHGERDLLRVVRQVHENALPELENQIQEEEQ